MQGVPILHLETAHTSFLTKLKRENCLQTNNISFIKTIVLSFKVSQRSLQDLIFHVRVGRPILFAAT